MGVDFLGIGALALISVEWLALGWLSGVRFPQHTPGAEVANSGLRVLVGASLVALAQLVLALVGVGFSAVPAVLAVAAIAAVGLRVAQTSTQHECEAKLVRVERRERLGWA